MPRAPGPRRAGESCSITLGVVLLLFVGVAAVVDRRHRQPRAGRHAWPPSSGDFGAPGAAPGPRRGAARAPRAPTGVPRRRAFAILRIPRLGRGLRQAGAARAPTTTTLTAGVGHYTGTAMPGAGRQLRRRRAPDDVRRARSTTSTSWPRGTAIVVETADELRRLRGGPARHRDTGPTSRSSRRCREHPGARPTQRWMTLTACHPKYSASAALHRLRPAGAHASRAPRGCRPSYLRPAGKAA